VVQDLGRVGAGEGVVTAENKAGHTADVPKGTIQSTSKNLPSTSVGLNPSSRFGNFLINPI